MTREEIDQYVESTVKQIYNDNVFSQEHHELSYGTPLEYKNLSNESYFVENTAWKIFTDRDLRGTAFGSLKMEFTSNLSDNSDICGLSAEELNNTRSNILNELSTSNKDNKFHPNMHFLKRHNKPFKTLPNLYLAHTNVRRDSPQFVRNIDYPGSNVIRIVYCVLGATIVTAGKFHSIKTCILFVDIYNHDNRDASGKNHPLDRKNCETIERNILNWLSDRNNGNWTLDDFLQVKLIERFDHKGVPKF